MAHRCTVVNPLPAGSVGLTLPSPWGAPGIPAIAGQQLTLDDAGFSLVPQYWFTTQNSLGAAVLIDNGMVNPAVPSPTVLSVSPATTPHAAPTSVTLTGTFFTGATSVTFNGVAGTALSVTNAQTIAITPPAAGAAGPAIIQVTTPGGIATLPSGFSYT